MSDPTKLSYYPEALRLSRDQPISPRMAIVHPTNLCQHRCADCEYASTRECPAPPASMDPDRLLGLVDEIADLGAAGLLFSGGGEPTLHPALPVAIARAADRGLSVGLFTNGVKMSPNLLEVLVRKAAFVRISMDAATAATYRAIRGVDHLEPVKNNVRALVSARLAGSSLEIGLKYLVRREPDNIAEIPAFCALAEKLGVDNVQFKPLRQGAGEPSAADMHAAQALISAERTQTRRLKISGGMSDSEINAPACWISPLRVVISADGGVHLCNYFRHRQSTHTFGNINEKPLAEIWFGPEHREALKRIDPAQCGLYDCRFHKLNRELSDLVKNHRAEFDFV